MKQIELILNNVFLALQGCLGLCQLMMLTPVGALMQCVVGWLFIPLRHNPTYSRLQHCAGRVFKKTNCFVLQAHTPSQRSLIEAADKLDTIRLWYLGRRFLLEKSGREGNMLLINGEMSYYITSTIWEELLNFGEATLYDVPGPAGAATVDACADEADIAAAIRVALVPRHSTTVFVKGYRQCYSKFLEDLITSEEVGEGIISDSLRRLRHCWKDMMSGGVMTFKEVVEGIVLDDQRVMSNPLNSHWLLPINLSVSKKNFLKFLNLAGFFLHGKVHWLIPVAMSLISALMEISTRLKVWFYTNINMLLCHIIHLKPSEGVALKSERAKGAKVEKVILAGGAKVEKEGAKVEEEGPNLTLVPWLHVADEEITCDSPSIEKQFGYNIACNYVRHVNRCYISAATITIFSVECKGVDEFRHIITLVSWMANNGCGSLKSRGPNNKVFVRGFKESVLSYVKNGCPPMYELELENAVVG